MPLSAFFDPAIGVFAVVAILTALVGWLWLHAADSKKRHRRLAAVAGRGGRAKRRRQDPVSVRRGAASGRFPKLEQVLRRIVPKQEGLRARLAQTGHNISIAQFMVVSLLVGAVAAGILMLMLPAVPPAGAAAAGLIAGYLLPKQVVGVLARRRVKRFLQELPDAIDVVTRGLKSGLPVTEMIATVGTDFGGPIGVEFKRVADNLHFGMTLDQALWDAARRIDVPEFNFLAISIGVQRETGGNLTETLSNLSGLLRKRHQMAQKVKAMSSEARASAYIIGSLPFIMIGILMLVNPEYIGKLFHDPKGNWFLAGAVATEVVGALVMFRMVRFEI